MVLLLHLFSNELLTHNRFHVLHNLKPYICLLEHCSNPQTAFGCFEEWMQHIKEEQQESTSNVFATCPLCSYTPNNEDVNSLPTKGSKLLEQHIADHLLSLASLRLPLSRPEIPESGVATENTEISFEAKKAQPFPLAPLPHLPNWVLSGLLHPKSLRNVPPSPASPLPGLSPLQLPQPNAQPPAPIFVNHLSSPTPWNPPPQPPWSSNIETET